MNNYTTNLSLATSLLHRALHEGGASYWTTISTPTTGYTVGIDRYGKIINSEQPNAVEEVKDYITQHHLDGAGIGLWVDQDTGILYLDVVLVFYDKDQALRYAVEQSQLAIYDIENDEVIDVEYEEQI